MGPIREKFCRFSDGVASKSAALQHTERSEISTARCERPKAPIVGHSIFHPAQDPATIEGAFGPAPDLKRHSKNDADAPGANE
jgi:hypothetical protein